MSTLAHNPELLQAFKADLVAEGLGDGAIRETPAILSAALNKAVESAVESFWPCSWPTQGCGWVKRRRYEG